MKGEICNLIGYFKNNFHVACWVFAVYWLVVFMLITGNS